MKPFLILPALLLVPIFAQAASPMTAEEFAAYTEGKTLTFAMDGQPYGAEQYMPGNKVRWAFDGDECLEGEWYPSGDMICFAYEGALQPQCWHFYKDGGRLSAEFVGENGTALYEAWSSEEPLACIAPGLGV